jgi:hypothetical protein
VDSNLARACKVLGPDRDAFLGWHKDEATTRLRDLVVLVGVEVYGVKVRECRERPAELEVGATITRR